MNISHDVFLPTLLYYYIYAPTIKLNSIMVFWIEGIIFPFFYNHLFVA